MPSFENMSGYPLLWGRATVRPEWRKRAQVAADYITVNRERYEGFGDIPWQFIGVVHYMESGGRFDRHIHNGDPLTSRTKDVPSGRPEAAPADGKAYTWEESTRDWITLKGLDRVKDWSIARMLYEAERNNGWGYLNKCNSPYLWSGTTLYTRGKYIRDHVWSSTAVSGQIGVVPMLKLLMNEEVEPMTDLVTAMKTYATVAPELVRRIIDGDTFASKVLREALNQTRDADIPAALDALSVADGIEVIKSAEGLLVQLLGTTVPAPTTTTTTPAPTTTTWDNLFSFVPTGTKTYLSIMLAVLANIAGIFWPAIISHDMVLAVDLFLGGFGGASLISKIERVASTFAPKTTG
jgi:lysozyme family protein